MTPEALKELPPPSMEVVNQYEVMTAQGPIGVELSQTSTRVDKPEDFVLTGEQFQKNTINWEGAKQHVAIHEGGQVAGSQFNSEAFANPDEIAGFLDALLPDSISYDQADRAELTLDVHLPNDLKLGYSGVKSIDELTGQNGVSLTKGMRQPGGQTAEVDGIKGAWYPEMTRDQNTGNFTVATNADGGVKNAQGKFEPEVNIAKVQDAEAMATNKLTVVIQKGQDGNPQVLTMFPGENAPALPAVINSEQYQANSLHSPAAEYWNRHAFLQAA